MTKEISTNEDVDLKEDLAQEEGSFETAEEAEERDLSKDEVGSEKQEPAAYDSKNRFFFIDNLRGVVMFMLSFMVVVYRFPFIPYHFGHVCRFTNGIGLADIGIPAFVFLLSVMMSYNLRRKLKEKGTKFVVQQTFIRGIALIGAGFILNFFGGGMHDAGWSIVATYGFASVLMLAFLPIKKSWIRFVIGMGIMLVNHVVLRLIYPAMSAWVPGRGDGGVFGTIPYLGLMLVCTALGEMYFSNKKKFYVWSIVVGAIAIISVILRFAIPSDSPAVMYFYISKHYQTFAFLTISLAIILALFIALDKWKYLHKQHVPIIGVFGKNPLLFFAAGGITSQIAWMVIGRTSDNAPWGTWVWYDGHVGHLFIALAITMIPLLIMAYLFQKFKIRLSI
ncbi:MAG: hypothetical protein FWC11_05020 [Firmicutes bacterium]|nr:hypothetical protein [Bacillota bacterium]MCL2256205.1 hypothetical protein [Bacillota bacterium]